MNSSIYPDILPSNTKKHYQNDYLLKEEIKNNDNIITKSKVNILEDMSLDENLSEKKIMKQFISTVSGNIKNSNPRDISMLLEEYPSIEENIVKAASILFFSIGHSSLLHNNSCTKKSDNNELNEKDFESMDCDNSSDSDTESSCSETECYYCGYYPIRNELKRQRSHCNKKSKLYNKFSKNKRQNLTYDFYESNHLDNNTLSYIKSEPDNSNDDNNICANEKIIKTEENTMVNDNIMKIENDSRNIIMNKNVKMNDHNQNINKKLNFKRKKEIKINITNFNGK